MDTPVEQVIGIVITVILAAFCNVARPKKTGQMNTSKRSQPGSQSMNGL